MATPLKGRFVVFKKWLLVRLGYIWLGDCPAGLEPSAGARNRRKATMKIRRNPLLCFLYIIRKFFRLSVTAGGSGRQASWPPPSDLYGSRKYPPLRKRTPRRKKLNLNDGDSIINIGQWKHKAFKASSSKPFGDLLLSLASCHSSNINLFFE